MVTEYIVFLANIASDGKASVEKHNATMITAWRNIQTNKTTPKLQVKKMQKRDRPRKP